MSPVSLKRKKGQGPIGNLLEILSFYVFSLLIKYLLICYVPGNVLNSEDTVANEAGIACPYGIYNLLLHLFFFLDGGWEGVGSRTKEAIVLMPDKY